MPSSVDRVTRILGKVPGSSSTGQIYYTIQKCLVVKKSIVKDKNITKQKYMIKKKEFESAHLELS